MKKDNGSFIKISVVVTYLAMVTVNALAGILPINGVTTGQVSDAYPNLFAPAGFAFAIWGIIYLLLALHTLYQCGFFRKAEDDTRESLLNRVGIYFVISSIANTLWIFAWHYGIIWLSLVLMIILLSSLIKIADILRGEKLSSNEKIFMMLPFSIYFGWITVATIANATIFLVGLGWNGFGIPDFLWTSIILLVGALIGIWRMNKDKDAAYGSVLIWAYFWILYKHFSEGGFAQQYPSIIIIVILCLSLLALSVGRIVFKK